MSRAQAVWAAADDRPGYSAHHGLGVRSLQYDAPLALASVFLLSLGVIMVTSSSITMADRLYNDPYYFLWRQLIALTTGLLCGLAVLNTPLRLWQKMSAFLLFAACFLLIAVLLPGVGKEINGSMRWIPLGPINLQGSEVAKLFVVTYIAAYLVRHNEAVRQSFSGFIKPIMVATIISALLLLQPDYGAMVVLFVTILGMLFMAGAPLGRFMAWMLTALAALGCLAIISPYRMQRLTGFIDPWQDPFNSGFQLTQALIAFGRGEWLGVGLGGSVQKLFYLPEAHTDFVFAVLAEELGLLFSLAVIIAFFFIIQRALVIAHRADEAGDPFAAYMAYGAGLILGLQAFVNMGVNTGLLPTKGLTLPLLSYGSNSIIISCLFIALLLRIDDETQRRMAAPTTAAGSGDPPCSKALS